MTRYAILVEFDGAAYSGWQVQRDVPTIQGRLESALQQLTQEAVRVVGAGRTDAGVHARGQVAHFDVTRVRHPSDVYIRGLNSYLPADILVKDCSEVAEAFHARYDAVRRTYRYEITRVPAAIGREYHWYVSRDLETGSLQEMADLIAGEHDFTSFMHAQSSTENTVCDIFTSGWTTEEQTLRYEITGNRFLHNMVRCLVGTMIEVARGRYTVGEFRTFLDDPDQEAPVYRAPAHGLFLEEVAYRQPLFQETHDTKRESPSCVDS